MNKKLTKLRNTKTILGCSFDFLIFSWERLGRSARFAVYHDPPGCPRWWSGGGGGSGAGLVVVVLVVVLVVVVLVVVVVVLVVVVYHDPAGCPR